jgi:hypothetical protein
MKSSNSAARLADLAFDLRRMGIEIESQDFDSPGTWSEQSGEHLDGRGLARAIGPKEAEELPGSDAEIHAVHGDEFSEATGQGLGGDAG